VKSNVGSFESKKAEESDVCNGREDLAMKEGLNIKGTMSSKISSWLQKTKESSDVKVNDGNAKQMLVSDLDIGGTVQSNRSLFESKKSSMGQLKRFRLKRTLILMEWSLQMSPLSRSGSHSQI